MGVKHWVGFSDLFFFILSFILYNSFFFFFFKKNLDNESLTNQKKLKKYGVNYQLDKMDIGFKCGERERERER